MWTAARAQQLLVAACSSRSARAFTAAVSRIRLRPADRRVPPGQRWVEGAALVGGGALAAGTISPGGLNCETTRVRVGSAADFEDGTMVEVPISGDATVMLHKHGGQFYAMAPICSHYGAPLRRGVTSSGGERGGPSVLHDATFDLRTGQVLRGPGLHGIAAYKVDVVDGDVFVELPQPNVTRAMATRDTKDQRVFALVGSGPAALAAAETLRQEGFGGRVVMVTREPHLPYDRVGLSKNLDQTAETLQLRPAEFFDKCGIEVIREAVVTRLDTKGQTLHYTVNNGEGTSLKYDAVLVASGCSPRKLFVPGAGLKGIFTLRTPEDAAEITSFARKGLKTVVIGGSFIGMEVASTLKKRGCDVAVVAMETVPFERVLGKKVGASFARLLQREGVEWFGNAQVRLFRGNDIVNGVELEDGEVLPADAVVIGAGVLPNTRFVEGTSLDKNGALVVNPLLASDAAPGLFAAGDVCSYPSFQTGMRVRIEHWDVATQQGRVAARNMLGLYQPFTAVPFFWSGLFGKTLRFVGHAPDVLDRVIVEGDVSAMEFISYYTEDDEIRAVATVNKDSVAVACGELMRRGRMPRVSELMLGVVNGDVILQRMREMCASTK